MKLHYTGRSHAERRAAEYPTAEEFMEAYFEEREGKPAKMEALIARRAAVKARIKKPTTK